MGSNVSVLVAALFAALVGAMHCGGPAKEGQSGAECFRAEECAAGLVCIDKVCTSDLTSVNFPTDAAVIGPPDAGAGTPD